MGEGRIRIRILILNCAKHQTLEMYFTHYLQNVHFLRSSVKTFIFDIIWK